MLSRARNSGPASARTGPPCSTPPSGKMPCSLELERERSNRQSGLGEQQFKRTMDVRLFDRGAVGMENLPPASSTRGDGSRARVYEKDDGEGAGKSFRNPLPSSQSGRAVKAQRRSRRKERRTATPWLKPLSPTCCAPRMLRLASCTAAKFLPVTRSAAGFAERRKRSNSEPFDEKAVTESAVADYQRALSEPFHYRSDDARTGEDDLGALGLQSDD